MNNVPAELSPSQLEAKQILDHLLLRLQDPDSRYHSRYAPWIQRHPRLADFCLHCVRPQVWTSLQSRWTLDNLKLIGGDLRFEGRAIYLNGILGLDRRVRVYVGQSTSLRQRVAQHLNFRYRRDNPSLHYHALQNSVYNTIGVVAVLPSLGMGNQGLPGMDAPELLLNVLEMWMALVFRALPEQISEVWLPSEAGDERRGNGVFGGLNVASPLDTGQKEREWVDLSESNDILVREYMRTRFGIGDESKHATRIRNEDREKEDDTPTQRQKSYAVHAKRFNEAAQNDIRVPQWVAVSALAAMVGLVIVSSRSGLQQWK